MLVSWLTVLCIKDTIIRWNFVRIYIYIYIYVCVWALLKIFYKKLIYAKIIIRRESPCSVVANVLDCGLKVCLNSSHAITFTFRQIPLGKAWASLSPSAMG